MRRTVKKLVGLVLVLMLVGMSSGYSRRYSTFGAQSISDAISGSSNVKIIYPDSDSTSDHTRIQAALDSYGTAVLMGGAYEIGGTILMGNNNAIIGNGRPTLTAASGLDNPMVSNADYDEDDAHNSYLEVSGIVFDHDRANQDETAFTIEDASGNSGCLWFNEVLYLVVKDNEILNPARAGCCIVDSNDILMLNNKVDNADDDSLAIDAYSERALVSGNIITDHGKNAAWSAGTFGIEVQDGASFVTVVDNIIHCATTVTTGKEPSGIGIVNHTGFPASHDIVISNNQIYNPQDSAIMIDNEYSETDWPYNIKIVGNTVSCETMGAIVAGMNLQRIRNSFISDNIIYKDDSSQYVVGYQLAEVEDTVISRNKLFCLSGGTNASDKGLTFDSDASKGLSLIRLDITDNQFTNCDSSYFNLVDDASGSVMTDVTIARNHCASPDVSVGDPANFSNGDTTTYLRCRWFDNDFAEDVSTDIVDTTLGFYAGGWQVDTALVYIAANGTGDPAAFTMKPPETLGLRCLDTDGGTLTVSESGAVRGTRAKINVISSYSITVADQAGVLTLSSSPWVMTVGDVLELEYVHNNTSLTGQWYEVNRVDN